MFRKKSAAMLCFDVLEKEKRAVLAGDLGKLHGIMREKERLIALLPTAQLSIQEMREIRGFSSFNNTLLAAAAQGIDSAAKTLAALAATPATLNTYDPDGNQISIPVGPENVQRQV